MKISYFFLFFLINFFFSSSCFADEINLGTFNSQELILKETTDLIFKIKEKKISISSAESANWFKEKSSLDIFANYKSEIENNNFCAYQKSPTCKLSFDYRLENKLKKKVSIILDTEKVKKSLADLAEKINQDPVNSLLKIKDGKVIAFTLSENGLILDKDNSLKIIIDALKNRTATAELNLPYEEISPTINPDSIEKMGLDTLLGEGHSNFRGSPKNRVFNIEVATNRFNGLLIKPSEEFSFVDILGEVDGEHGYLPELVIKQDKTEPEFGGGICQVSTTAFRAAIYSGLEITARRNHAYPVSYYNPQGMDSTVYVPKPDLRFKNDTPGYILIQTKIVGTELIFQFYGTSDGRKTTVIGPTILEKNPDGSMKTTFTQQIYDQNNNLIREDEFKSSYASPSKYPHPGETSGLLAKKPKNWSDHEWKVYKKEHKID